MTMRSRLILFALSLTVILPGVARAQDFGVMESAETINRGNFKIRLNPMFLIGRYGQDHQIGVAIVAGYGFTDRFDMEGGVALYRGITMFGANVEYWVVKDKAIDFSIAGGLHGRRGDNTGNATGVDLTFLPSKHINDRLDIYGAIDVAFEHVADKFGGQSFKTVHFVPGIEYKLNSDLDFVAEFGVALTKAARHYLSGGIAYYFR